MSGINLQPTGINKNLMQLSADRLKQADPELRILDGIILKHVRDIEKKIIEEYKTSSKPGIIYNDIELNFPVTVMKNKEAQYYVYSNILDQLKINNYGVNLSLKTKSPILKVWWLKDAEQREKDRQIAVVREAMNEKAPF